MIRSIKNRLLDLVRLNERQIKYYNIIRSETGRIFEYFVRNNFISNVVMIIQYLFLYDM